MSPPPKGYDSATSVPALRRAVQILDLVTEHGASLSSADIARRLRIPKSTCHGLINAMVELGLLNRTSGGSVRIGPKSFRWGYAFFADVSPVEEFQEVCQHDASLKDVTVTLSVLEGRDVVYVGCKNSDAPLGLTFRIGMRLPAVYTATGKAMLSTVPDEDLDEMFKDRWPQPLTPHGVGSLDGLRAELSEVRERGYSIDDGQIRDGMLCIGAPIRDHTGRSTAGVAASILLGEATAEEVDRLGEKMLGIAAVLAARLG